MKAILQSIKPQHCANIAAGKKTIEVRKTKPKIKTPFKVYIYCTKGEKLWKKGNSVFLDKRYNRLLQTFDYMLNGKIIGEYMCDEIETVIPERYPFSEIGTCLTPKQILDYGGNKPIYFWHISNLVIYDKPKELYEFNKLCTDPYQYCQGCKHGLVKYPSDVETYEDLAGCCFDTVCVNQLQKPPQSWCYVEVKE